MDENLKLKMQTYCELLITVGGRSPAIFMGKESKKIVYLSKFGEYLTEWKSHIVLEFGKIHAESDIKNKRISEINNLIRLCYEKEEIEKLETEARILYDEVKKINQIKNGLDKIVAESKNIQQEKGIATLCLGRYFIDLKIDKEVFRAPLVLESVDIDNSKNNMKINFNEEKWNLNLLFTLDKFVNKNISSEFKNKEITKESIVELLTLINQIYVTSREVKIKDTTKAEQKQLDDYFIFYPQVISFGIYDGASQAIFEETKKVVEDLANTSKNLTKVFDNHFDLEDEKRGRLLCESFDEETRSFLDESELNNITHVDYSQAMLANSAQHTDLVVQGPPGTGKTETILNIVSDLFVENKKILIVTEKKVALDVLYARIAKNSKPLAASSLYLKGSADANAKLSLLEQIRDAFDFTSTTTHNELYDVKYPLNSEEYENLKQVSTNHTKLRDLKNSSATNNYKKFETNYDNYIKMYDTYNDLQALKIKHNNETSEFYVNNISNYTYFSELYKVKKEFTDLEQRYFADQNEINGGNIGLISKIKYMFNKTEVMPATTWVENLAKFEEYAKLMDAVNNNITLLDITKEELDMCFEHKNLLTHATYMQSITKKLKKYQEDVKQVATMKPYIVAQKISNINSRRRDRALSFGATQLYKKRNNTTRFNGSIRNLILESEAQFKELFPIVLATPLNLASLFDYEVFKNHFDYIIYDEASQLLPQNAVHSLSLAKNVIVVGDSKQLKPSTTFAANNLDNEKMDELDIDEANESLLDIAVKNFGTTKQKMLNYHYRSEHKALIEFSNSRFYNNKLIAINNVNYNDIPYEIVKVDNGVWLNNENINEARALVDKLLEVRTNYATKSIGIITMNQKQMDVIKNEINYRMNYDLKFNQMFGKEFEVKDNDDYIFVKNIENVQGDERDIILFSLGFAYNSEGSIRANYGPINKEGGENRLNVAFTRAKYKFVLIKSIDAAEIKTTEKVGTTILRDFVLYVEACVDGDVNQIYNILGSGAKRQDNIFDSIFEEEVFDELKDKLPSGYRIGSQHSTHGYSIDLVIYNSMDLPVIGIECDGRQYHSTIDAKERDYYRQQYLENRGWTIHRIWSTDWWSDNSNEVNKVLDALNKKIGN